MGKVRESKREAKGVANAEDFWYLGTMQLPRPVRNRDIMLRALEGQDIELIAEQVGLEASTVQGILRSPLVAQEMERLQKELGRDIAEKAKERAHEALEVVTDTMRGEVNSELRFKAAVNLLDRHPDLKDKGEAKNFGEGLGESIIRELGKLRREREAITLEVPGDPVADDQSGD